MDEESVVLDFLRRTAPRSRNLEGARQRLRDVLAVEVVPFYRKTAEEWRRSSKSAA
jgi:hypothetical protein